MLPTTCSVSPWFGCLATWFSASSMFMVFPPLRACRLRAVARALHPTVLHAPENRYPLFRDMRYCCLCIQPRRRGDGMLASLSGIQSVERQMEFTLLFLAATIAMLAAWLGSRTVALSVFALALIGAIATYLHHATDVLPLSF